MARPASPALIDRPPWPFGKQVASASLAGALHNLREGEAMHNVHCIGCNRTPEDIEEYLPENTGEDLDAIQYVIAEEGTYNPENGHFLCTSCYIAAGMPTAPGGWRAP